MLKTSAVAKELKRLRERAGLSVRALADRVHLSPSSYAYYEDEFKRRFLPIDLLKQVAPVLAEHGIPESETYRLAGITGINREGSAIAEVDHDAPLHGTNFVSIDELDIRSAAGVSGMAEPETKIGEWSVPNTLVRTASNAPSESIKILTIVGDSMPSSFRPFDKVMVDTKDKNPTPPGIFMVWEGGGLVAKRVMAIPHSEPPMVRVMSENPDYPPYERPLVDAHIQGRVLGKWQWI
jgi:phage repressor protein C with HTH and peptisase S24 domain